MSHVAASGAPLPIACAAGGTGGHLFPAEALARELQRRGHPVVLYTERRGAAYTRALAALDHVVLPARSLEGGLPGKVAAGLTILRATWQARADMRRRGVRLLVGFGGYPSFAPALAAKSLGLPLLLHEQGARLSLANRKLLRFADGVATSFPATAGVEGLDPARVFDTGNPVRAAILDAQGDSGPVSGDGPLHLLVVGGSQSARVFGEVVPPALLQLPDALRVRLHVRLQYKGDSADAIVAALQAAGITATLQPFFDDMGACLRQAHLVITRAGATTAADLLAVGRPAIFVPIPHGGSRDEQRRNAEALAAAGVGWCVPESEFTPARLATMLGDAFATPHALPDAARAAAALGRPHAAVTLADRVVETLRRHA